MILDELDWLEKYLAGEPGPIAVVRQARQIIAAQIATVEACESLRQVLEAARQETRGRGESVKQAA